MVWGHLDWGFNYRPDLNTFSLFFLTFFLFSFSFYAVLLCQPGDVGEQWNSRERMIYHGGLVDMVVMGLCLD